MNTELRNDPSNEYEPFPRAALEQSIASRFADIVRRFPDKLAVSSATRAWTYQQLDSAANQIAYHIRNAGLAPRAPVLLNMRHDAPAIAAIIGVLKSDNFYCALDGGLPGERLQTIVKTLRPELIICDGANIHASRELAGSAIPLLNVDAPPEIPDEPFPSPNVSPDSLAYVFFTSGSTGEPKGVMDSQRNVLHNILRYTNNLHINCDDRLSLLQSLAFSGSVSSLFCALLNGATICPCDVRQQSAASLARWIIDQQLTIFHSVPSIFRLIAAEGRRFPRLRIVRLEGDHASPADAALFQKHFPAACVLVNGLGATECGIVRQYFLGKDSRLPANSLPLGYPVEDMEVSLLDDDGGAVGTNAVGEIVVKSRYLALGYWDRADLTAKAFSSDIEDAQTRYYHTGDLGRMTADGCLEYLGRKDFQAKVRGQRVNLADIEAAFLQCDGVKEAVAVVGPDRSGENRVVVYYTTGDDRIVYLDHARRSLRARLDNYSLPSWLVKLDHLPLNSNGKIDRRALPPPSPDRTALRTAYVPPQNLLQQQVAHIWERLFQIRPVGVLDNFFDLGGQSLIAAEFSAEVEKLYRRSFPTQCLLIHPTVEAIATLLQGEAEEMSAPIVELQRGSSGVTPFYFLHGDYLSGGLYCVNLGRHLEAQQPFYLLPPCGANGYPILPSYGEMARLHIQILRAKQPNGPYFLGGTCNGGLVAYEMARQLSAQGESVEALILIHATAENLRYRFLRKLVTPLGLLSRRTELDCFVWLQPYWRKLSELPFSAILPFILRKIFEAPRRAIAFASSRFPIGVEAQQEARPEATSIPAKGNDIRERYLRIESEYIPRPYSGKVFLLWADGDIESPDDAQRWWRQIAPRSELISIPGTPHTVSLTDHAEAVAKTLTACIARR